MNTQKRENVLFLDYDGVINIEPDNFSGYFENPEAIYFINKLCIENDFKIVVTSSWKNHPQYVDFLHDAGLDSKVEIIGCTEMSFKSREYEIKQFLNEHPGIGKYLIIDDADFSPEMNNHLVQTAFKIGFNKVKYQEAIEKINKMDDLVI
ncbi:MAG: HAD domain-containing protein [Bacilli bacterium]